MDYFPVNLKLSGNSCLLVGDGEAMLAKARLLRKSSCRLVLVAESPGVELVELINASGGEVLQRPFEAQDVVGHRLVIASCSNETTALAISEAARQRSVLVNIIDRPELCDFIFPAIVDRDPLVVAISSSGSAPVLARRVRDQIESLLPANLGVLGQFITARRQEANSQLRKLGVSVRQFWEQLLDGPVTEQLLTGNTDQAEQAFNAALSSADQKNARQGEVYLLGAGPGDPDLMTFKARRLLQKADVILYDRLVNEAIVDLGRRDARRIYVGKSRGDHTLPQKDINALMIELAQQGNIIARLKGGDPFVFGRGGEELEGLAQQQIPFQVVPGVSAANGCACYAGIPLTHRDYAQSVRFITGHLKEDGQTLPWQSLHKDTETLVIYMGLTALANICQQLIELGWEADTPAALVEQGTLPGQRVHIGRLDNLASLAEAMEVGPPTLIIVGKIIEFRNTLAIR